jgi:serine/threonine protein kinase/tetratricopeptide (TPR) repeat protein
MTPERWDRLKPLFDAAILKTPADRDAFLATLDLEEEDRRELLDLVGAFDANAATSDHLAQQLQSLTPDVLSTLRPGEVLAGRFRIVRWLGHGGMGTVYEAVDLELSEVIALKIIRPSIALDPQCLDRFRKEVHLARRFSGPNICRIHELYVREDTPGRVNAFLTMEFLDGVTLAEEIQRSGPLPWPRASRIAEEICAALAEMHAAGVIHRDVKTRNVMLAKRATGVCAVLMDFGLAREVSRPNQQDETASTMPGTLLGTPACMAPEQFSGDELTRATDIYALGVVLYEMTTAREPFAAGDAVRAAILRATPPAPPSTVRKGLPHRLDSVVARCLEVDPSRRYQSATELARDLRAFHVGPRFRAGPKYAVLACLLSVGIIALMTWGPVKRLLGPGALISRQGRVLVADFDNLTDNSDFTGVSEELLDKSLSQSHYAYLVPRSAARDATVQMGLPDVTRIDPQLARALCRREKYNAFVVGEISKNGTGSQITASIMLPGSTRAMRTETEQIRSSEGFVSALDRLAIKLRRDLGEPEDQIRASHTPLVDVTTPSLKAFQRYSRAADYYRSRDYSQAAAMAQDAIQFDPHFAMAHLLLARTYEETGSELDSRREYQAARSNLGSHLSAREAHLIVAGDLFAQGMNEKAANEYHLVLDIYPDDLDALQGFAQSSYWAGRPEQAIQAAQRAVSLDPNNVEFYDELISLYVRTNRFSEALATAQNARDRKLETTAIRFDEALARWGMDDLASARDLLVSLDDATSTYWRAMSMLSIGKLQAYQGHIAEAKDTLESGLALVELPGWESWVPIFRYQIAKGWLVAGNQGMARQEVMRYVESANRVPTASNMQRAVILCVAARNLTCAQVSLATLSKQVAAHPDAFSEMELYIAEASVELARGKAEEAIHRAQRALAFYKDADAYQVLEAACEAAHIWSCSLGAGEEVLSQKGEVLKDDFAADVPLSYLAMARVNEALGSKSRATEYNRAFRNAFASCDQTLPALRVSRQISSRISQQAVTH